jgi:hypothetical protein
MSIPARTLGTTGPAVSALDLRLTADDVAALERAIPHAAAGDRYPAQQMGVLDSERG